jgi:adenylosuccinate lyase
MHGRIRNHAMKAWEALKGGGSNPLITDLCEDREMTVYLKENEIRIILEDAGYIGNAPERARALAKTIRGVIPENKQ